jgi:dTDP-4-amino-4,6-dideoxygalactose transaminase
MDEILKLARDYNLFVIEDAAHAIESVYKGRKIGSIGHCTAFSFYATKNITTGEGGMLTTNDDELAEKVRILSLHGLSKSAWKRYYAKGFSHYDVLHPGYKYNMSDIQASLGIHQLQKIEGFWRRRKEIVDRYNEAFKDIPELSLIPQIPKENSKNAYHLYVVLLKTKVSRDQVAEALQAENIGVGVHYRAVHLQPYYMKTFGYKKGSFVNAEYASERILSLPLYPSMTDEDVEDVITAVKKVINYYRE